MTISCKAVGGPPNPLVSWTLPDENTDMMSDPIEYETSEITIAEEDSDTLEVISYISFMASKDLNNADVSCHAINEVMREPITDIVALDIMCKIKKIKERILFQIIICFQMFQKQTFGRTT